MTADARRSAPHAIPSEIGALEFIDNDDQLYLAELARELLDDQVVLFAGAGVSKNAACCDGGESRIPDWLGLSKLFRSRLGGHLESLQDVLKIADYYEAKYGRARLIDDVILALRDEDHLPGRVHEKLVELNFAEILTTNFDTLIERAFRKLHISPQVVTSDSDLAQRRRHPRILKVNGCLTNGSNIVLTGNDFLAYSRNHPLIEVFITKCFVESTVLFVGFSLDDPAFRILNEKVVSTLGPDCRQAYSLGFAVSEEQRRHWCARKVQLIDLAPVRDDASLQKDHQPIDYEDRLFQVLDSLAATRRRMRSVLGGRSPDSRRTRRPKSARYLQAESAVDRLWKDLGSLRSREHARKQKATRKFFREMSETWTLDGLAANDLDRCRFLTYTILFAPLPVLVRLADVWLGPDGEEKLIHRQLRPFQPTPVEYRVPLLGFCGLLQQSPDLYREAADSLWARQLDVGPRDIEPDGADDPLEIAFRFRYLLQAGRLDDWPTSELQMQRLEMVLRRLFLEEGQQGARSSDLAEAVLTDLLRGWVFGSRETPESFRQAWDAVRRDIAKGHSEMVPWELLTVLTVMIRGKALANKLLYLDSAWHRGELDLTFLIEYVARRLDGVGEQKLDTAWLEVGRQATGVETPQRDYEEHLADLTRWLCERAATESADSRDRLRAVEILPEPIYRWASDRKQYRQLNRAILESFAGVVALDPERLGPDLQRWVAEELPPGAKGLTELARLVPENHEALIDEDRIAEILRDFLEDGRLLSVRTRRWLLRWYSARPSRKKPTTALFGRFLSGQLLAESQTGSLGWLSLAASIQRRPKLRESVEKVLARRPKDAADDLFGFVRETLFPILEDLRQRLLIQEEDRQTGDASAAPLENFDAKVAAFHQNFAPFAEDLDEELLEVVLPRVEPENVSTRDGTAGFLAALLLTAPPALRASRSDQWKRDLERLIGAGATGRGTLGSLVARLSEEARDCLQDNLAAVAVQRSARNDAKPVERILNTLIDAPPGALPALEEALVELVASPSRKVADASLAGILGPLRERVPDFLDRHQRRLRRILAVVQRRGSFRPTSRFAARLEELGPFC